MKWDTISGFWMSNRRQTVKLKKGNEWVRPCPPDDVARANYEKYGHPDGKQQVKLGIALPAWQGLPLTT